MPKIRFLNNIRNEKLINLHSFVFLNGVKFQDCPHTPKGGLYLKKVKISPFLNLIPLWGYGGEPEYWALV